MVEAKIKRQNILDLARIAKSFRLFGKRDFDSAMGQVIEIKKFFIQEKYEVGILVARGVICSMMFAEKKYYNSRDIQLVEDRNLNLLKEVLAANKFYGENREIITKKDRESLRALLSFLIEEQLRILSFQNKIGEIRKFKHWLDSKHIKPTGKARLAFFFYGLGRLGFKYAEKKFLPKMTHQF